jgi:putative ABC transport system permease protein
VQVLGLFFALQPPVLTLPVSGLVALVFLVVAASAGAIGIALRAITRILPASILREP